MRNPYLEMEVKTAAPEVLIGRLLDRAVRSVHRAIEAVEADPPDCVRETTRAVDIVSELRSGLDMEVGGALSRDLDALYEYAASRLLLGNATSSRDTLGEALGVLQILAEGWNELLEQLRQERMDAP